MIVKRLAAHEERARGIAETHGATAVPMRRKQQRLRLQQALVYVLLVAGAAPLLVPFLWMLSTALKDTAFVLTNPPQWIPTPIAWHTFPDALSQFPFGLYFLNTSIITGAVIVGTVLSASLVAYGFARLRFPGRNVLFLVTLATMILPAQVTMIPTFILFRYLGWLNTFLPLTVPSFFGGGAFFIFLLRQFFKTIPRELDDAARIDGCGYWGIFWRIILPLSRSALAIVAIFVFTWTWTDFLTPLIYLTDDSKYTLAIGLASFQGLHTTAWNLLMAASIVVVLPTLIIFFIAQRYFIQGIVFTGLKG